MNKKITGIIGAGALIIVLVIGMFFMNTNIGNVVKETKNNDNLKKYRSLDIPEECRLPDYESDLNWWKEHLSHHQNTLYCLEEYYE